jgi:cytidine deaminase
MKMKLLEAAKNVLDNSYSPYSHFPVACALLAEDGTIKTGVNVENASFGLTICAERSACVSMVSSGHTDIICALVLTKRRSLTMRCLPTILI